MRKIRTTEAGTYWWAVGFTREKMNGEIDRTIIKMRKGRWGGIRSTTRTHKDGAEIGSPYSYSERTVGNGTWDVRPEVALSWLRSYVEEGYEIVSVDYDLRPHAEKLIEKIAASA